MQLLNDLILLSNSGFVLREIRLLDRSEIHNCRLLLDLRFSSFIHFFDLFLSFLLLLSLLNFLIQVTVLEFGQLDILSRLLFDNIFLLLFGLLLDCDSGLYLLGFRFCLNDFKRNVLRFVLKLRRSFRLLFRLFHIIFNLLAQLIFLSLFCCSFERLFEDLCLLTGLAISFLQFELSCLLVALLLL